MNRTIYLDCNATTPPRPEVVEEVARSLREDFGNPGSRHAEGRRARKTLESARERIAAILGATPQEVIFTSGGTESINLALRGLARGRGLAALPAGEHPATEQVMRSLEAEGWRRAVIPIDREGRIESDRLTELPWTELRLATTLLAHNETGVIQDPAPLAALCAEHRVPLHLDAVQAVGKIELNFRRLGPTALSFAAHKFHGPRGIGGLLLRDGVQLPPLLHGGHQERDRRPGTECTALASGMALALELWERERHELSARLAALRDRLEAGLRGACPESVPIGRREHRLPNTLSIAFAGCDGEALLVALDLAGVACSMGSTCASGSAEPAPVLTAMQVPPEIARGCVRFSLGRDNTIEEIEEAVRRISEAVARQRSAR